MNWRSKLGLFNFPMIPRGNLIHEICHLPVYHHYVKKYHPKDFVFQKYAFGKHSRQYVLHGFPNKDVVQKDKVVIFYHGGGWCFGSPGMFQISAAFYTRQGYHVFMPSYRRIPRFAYPTIRKDLSLGYVKVREVMEKEGLENQKIILSGMSAGANLAALLAYDRQSLKEMNRSQSDFEKILLMGAPLDLSQMSASPVLYAYAGMPSSASFKNASPITHLQSEETLPILMIHGTADGLVPYHSSKTFAEALATRQSENIEFFTIEGGTHLDTGSWNFFDNELRKKVEEWV